MSSLNNTNVLVFAATGSIGSITARHLAAQGAHVWASGRDADTLDALAKQIVADGGTVDTAVLDATDERAVDDHVDRVAAATTQAGARIDGVFNAIGSTPPQLGYPAVSTGLDLDTFWKPLHLILGSTFLTARSTARHLTAQGSGSIVTLSASIAGSPVPWMAALTATCAAIEGMTRSLAAELGPAGVRVNCVRGDAIPDTRTIPLTTAGMAAIAGVPPEVFAQQLPAPPLGRPVSALDTARTVAFLLSDAASATSAQVINVASRAMAG